MNETSVLNLIEQELTPRASDKGVTWRVTLRPGEDNYGPVLGFRSPAWPNEFKYFLLTAAEGVISGDAFVFGHASWLWTFSPETVAAIVKEAVERIHPRLGSLRVVWEADDPSVPF